MGTLGALEQFLVKPRDNWSPDRSVCYLFSSNCLSGDTFRKVPTVFPASLVGLVALIMSVYSSGNVGSPKNSLFK